MLATLTLATLRDVEGSLSKCTNRFITLLKASITVLVSLYQKGAITFELSDGRQPYLNEAVPPDKLNCDSPVILPEHSHAKSHLSHALSLANTSSYSHLETFDSDSVPLYIDTCVTRCLTCFKADFVPRTYNETAHTKKTQPQAKWTS